MRYIGNKTKLLPFLRSAIRRLGIDPGVVHDAFAGTAAVGRALKADGWHVHGSDLMTYSYTLQRAYVVAAGVDSFERLAAAVPSVAEVLRAVRRSAPTPRARRANGARAAATTTTALDAITTHLSTGVPPVEGFLSRHFGPRGGRMYFTDANAARIDAARTAIEHWREADLIDEDTYFVLLAAIIEGADRVANTAGVYAAFIKQWQPNARKAFALAPEVPIASGSGVAHLADAEEVAQRIGEVDLVYIDPPYNTRQYAGYYHIPELIARGWFHGPVALRGKTGLIEDREQRSAWCSRRLAPEALRRLLAVTGARHALVSYNSEGVIDDRQLRAIMRDAAVDGRVRRFTRRYKRYRADSDRVGRRYKGDEVTELLYHARLR